MALQFSHVRKTNAIARTTLTLCIPAALVVLCGCATNAPWLHHADDKPFYESAYFRVAPPQGSGWKGSEERPSSTLKSLGFAFEPDLFDEFIPARICFEKYTTADMVPHGSGGKCFIECYSTVTLPDSFHHDARLLAEAENRKTLSNEDAGSGSRSSLGRGSPERGVVTIGGREYHEFATVIGGSGERLQYLLQYISFPKDLDIAFVVNVRSDGDALPEDAKKIMEGLEPSDAEHPPVALAMERAARDVYNLTLTRIDGRPSDKNMDDLEKELADILQSDPQQAKAHLFLGATELLTEEPGPAFEEAQCEQVKMGLWDFFCVSDKGILLHSLFDGYSPAEKAIEHLDAAARAHPQSFWANYYLAGLCIRNGEYTRAETCARSLTEHYPESALAWYALGMSLKRNGNSAAARTAFSTALYNNRGEFAKLWWGTFRGKTIIDWQLNTLEGGR